MNKLFLNEFLCEELGFAISPERSSVYAAAIPVLKSKGGEELFEENFFLSLPKKIENKEEEKRIWEAVIAFCEKISDSYNSFSGVGVIVKLQEGCFLLVSGTYYGNFVEYRIQSKFIRIDSFN